MEPALVPGVPGVPAPVIVERPGGKPVLISPPEVNGAHDYAVIGYILVLLMTIPWFVIVLTIGALGALASPYLPFPIILPPALPAWLAAIPFIGPILILFTFPGVGLPASWFVYLAFGGVGLLIGIIFLLLVYFQTVRAISRGRYARARGGTLFWAVLFIIPVFAILVSPDVFYPTVTSVTPSLLLPNGLRQIRRGRREIWPSRCSWGICSRNGYCTFTTSTIIDVRSPCRTWTWPAGTYGNGWSHDATNDAASRPEPTNYAWASGHYT